jgi:hypothetical protein
MVRELRKGNGRNGLVLANGGTMTYQYIVCLSNKSRNSPYPDHNPLPDLLDDEQVLTVDEQAEGEAVVEVSHISIWLEDVTDPADIYCRIQSRWKSSPGICCWTSEKE